MPSSTAFSTIDNAYVFIAKEANPKTLRLSREFKANSRHDVIKTDNHGVFHIIYADLEHSIRGMGGNGPCFVFKENDNMLELVYRNANDEMVNRIEIIEENSMIELRTYAHIGLSMGPSGYSVYKWDGNKFVSAR
jgi:hypothetical protein